MTDQYAVAGSDWSDRWPQRIAMLARVVRGLDPAGSLDPDAWLQTLTLARLLKRLSNESGAAVALRTAIRDYLKQLLGHAEGDGRRMRLHHEVTRLLLAGGVEPLTAAEIEELGLTPRDEVEEG